MTSASGERLACWQRWHTYLLACKGVADHRALRTAIDADLAVAAAAVRRLVDAGAEPLLTEFFSDHPAVVADVVACAVGHRIDHLGFRIREPLDIWLEGLPRWAPRFEVEVVGTKRFTASSAFQTRVGAFVEMAQVWLQIGDEVVELELFDVHRANPALPEVFSQLRSGGGLSTMLAAAQPDELPSLLAGDDIWHYGVRIREQCDVEALHGSFLQLAAHDTRYRVRTESTVGNRWHGSVHTKLTNLEAAIEIEFLTYDVDWASREAS